MAELSSQVSQRFINFIKPGMTHLLNVDGTRKDDLYRTIQGPGAGK